MSDQLARVAIFQKQKIRKQLHNSEWRLVISDVVAALTNSTDPARYLRNLRARDGELVKLFERPVKKGASQIETPLNLSFYTPGGKQKLPCWNTEGIFRLIQSIPSKKAEPFKRWLARVGYERIQEIENPELAQKHMKAIYRAKGYDDAWIERRARGVTIRNELTDEWEKRGVKEGLEYAILTSEISKATSGITPSEYKKFKGLKRENLRDHMNNIEPLLTQLGAASTVEITRGDNANGIAQHIDAAKRGGAVAGTARERLERETGRGVVHKSNFLAKGHKGGEV